MTKTQATDSHSRALVVRNFKGRGKGIFQLQRVLLTLLVVRKMAVSCDLMWLLMLKKTCTTF
jgi:hypothetical protein